MMLGDDDDDDDYDLLARRRRLRDEARRRRREAMERERRKRLRRSRRSARKEVDDDEGSDVSRDLLESSSSESSRPSPSPPPPPPPDRRDRTSTRSSAGRGRTTTTAGSSDREDPEDSPGRTRSGGRRPADLAAPGDGDATPPGGGSPSSKDRGGGAEGSVDERRKRKLAVAAAAALLLDDSSSEDETFERAMAKIAARRRKEREEAMIAADAAAMKGALAEGIRETGIDPSEKPTARGLDCEGMASPSESAKPGAVRPPPEQAGRHLLAHDGLGFQTEPTVDSTMGPDNEGRTHPVQNQCDPNPAAVPSARAVGTGGEARTAAARVASTEPERGVIDLTSEDEGSHHGKPSGSAGVLSSVEAPFRASTDKAQERKKSMPLDAKTERQSAPAPSSALPAEVPMKRPPPKAQSEASTSIGTTDGGPVIGEEVRRPRNVEWSVQRQRLLVRTMPASQPRRRVAGFDLDGTLVNWRCGPGGWPSRLRHYELWNSAAIDELRNLHDDGYKIVVFSNQGGIKGAFDGKRATLVRGVVDWIAHLVDRPLHAVISTKSNAGGGKDGGYHKGEPGMWNVMEEYCNCGVAVDPASSFFVGDADGESDEDGGGGGGGADAEHRRSGVDRDFALNVGRMRGVEMPFRTPNRYFGPSDADRRRKSPASEELGGPPPAPPEGAAAARAALLGGYLRGPMLLILVGAQGSGKSSFCQYLVDRGGDSWRVFGQDTIRDGRPGTRQAVEDAARSALREKKCVAIDRMHLDSEQRGHFVRLGKECGVPVHGLVMMASKEDVESRVRRREDHPGGVEGGSGARLAAASLSRLEMPKYAEGFDLLSHSRQFEGLMWRSYQRVHNIGDAQHQVGPDRHPRTVDVYNGGQATLPMVSFGTMKLGKRAATSAVAAAIGLGIASVDTAPTYGNESEVGDELVRCHDDVTLIIKVPKRAIDAQQAREEVTSSLSQLRRSSVDFILLHWPCDYIEAGTLASVWKELEKMKVEGLCRFIGVCNFSTAALRKLLPLCSVKPALNQVERHPLLPQYDLLAFCASHDIVVQAHSPLGGGSDLLLGNGVVAGVSKESGMTPAQVLLCWNVQQGVPVVTKFSSAEHGRDGAALLLKRGGSAQRLSPQQMKAIDDIGVCHRFVAPPFMYTQGTAYSWKK